MPEESIKGKDRWITVKEERRVNVDTGQETGGGYECTGTAQDVLEAVQEALKAMNDEVVTVVITVASKS